jgi:hypothetical protein
MLESGIVKLASGDHTWSALTALDYHFETQPLPIWTSWYAHQLPEWLLCIATFVMFLVELIAPFLIVAPRRWRHGGAWALIALQVLILVTGNYAFFNFLTIALCLLLFEDGAWPTRWPRGSEEISIGAAWIQWTQLTRWLIGAGISLVVIVTVQSFVSRLRQVPGWPDPFMSFNAYGLFAVMTTSRHEIMIEGSNDGNQWREYEFRWKPGDLNERPHLVAPHQPRLDWQMWFASLSNVQNQPWFVYFLTRLLEGSPAVTGMLRTNPFPDHPPRYLRAIVYDYHFTRHSDGHPGWWKREPLGLYCPPITLENGQPALVKPAAPPAPK